MNRSCESAISRAEDRDENLDALFAEDLSHPGVKSLPRRIVIGNEDTLTLRARALGCELRFTLPNEAAAIHVAEAIASAFEAFLATSLNQHVTPYREYIRFELQPGVTGRFSTVWHSTPETWAQLTYPSQVIPESRTDRTDFDEWLRDLIGETIGRTLFIRNPEQWLQEVAGTEEGFSRAISLGYVPILASSVFGDRPLHRLEHWMSDKAPDYPLLRTMPWAPEARLEEEATGSTPAADRRSTAGEEPTFTDHSRVKVTSIIDMPLWDDAHWSGTGMAMIDDEPPVLALCFRNMVAGAQIFEGWRARFGAVDQEEVIRIAIIQGLTYSDPTGYAVTVGRYVETVERENPNVLLTMVSRINRMERASPENLYQFLAAYARHGSYRLVPMRMTRDVTLDAFRFDLAIAKHKLELRRAWQIGAHDTDMLALRDDDDPIVPDNVADPPVREALECIRAWRASQRLDQ